jgi:hypothetical protein
VGTKVAVFCVVVLCSLVEVYQCPRDACYHCHQGDHCCVDRGSRHVWKAGELPDHMALKPRRWWSLYFRFLLSTFSLVLTSLVLNLVTVLKITVFWDIAPYCVLEVDWLFRSAYCLHHRDYDWWNVSQLQQNYILCYFTKLSSSYLPPWEPEIWHWKCCFILPSCWSHRLSCSL